jgi:hypothetical protein
LQALIIDKGDAHRFAIQAGKKLSGFEALGHPRFFRYDLPMFDRGEIVVASLDDADDTFDLGDHKSESLAESIDESDDGGVKDASNELDRL